MLEMIHVIDLFSGAGGFSEGARAANAKVILAVDGWKASLAVHERNHPEAEHWFMKLGGSMTPVIFASKIKKLVRDRVPKNGRVHCHMSPPCQNLSKANHGRNEKEGMKCVNWCFQLWKLLPRTWTLTLEQVPSRVVLQKYASIQHRVVDMQDHGVPQSRRRVIFYHGFDWNIPLLRAPTLLQTLRRSGCRTRKGSAQANGGISMITGGYNHKSLNEISYTVTSCSPYEFVQGRRCRFKDCAMAALQTFPKGYFIGEGNRTMIGNALPPLMASHIIRSIR